METGDWRIVMFIDGTDTEGKATYQQIYQHQDGRKACVGPGFCSDPDLEWLLLQKDRKIKKFLRRRTVIITLRIVLREANMLFLFR